jgi:predicted DNA binding CopG/RHH family protein
MAATQEKQRKITVTFSIDQEDLERLKKEAAKADRTVSAYIRTRLKRSRTTTRTNNTGAPVNMGQNA